MCGICGIVRPGALERNPDLVQAMTDMIVHRGPNSAGHLSAGPVTVGMRRLSIIDLAGGDQPIFNEDRTVGVVLNGEIYNFRELAGELEARGHHFASHCDTEVIVHAFEEWGDRCVERLRGMFAFAVVDMRGGGTPRLFVARDHLGVKPLYYWSEGEVLVFASEVRALLASGVVPRRLDLHGMRSYLAYGSVQDPLTLVAGVRSLLPGHKLSWTEGKVETRRFWMIPGPDRVEGGVRDGTLAETRVKLDDAVGSQLVSDVPIGVFLSGGIDSTVIAALMQGSAGSQVKSFSIVFSEAAYDEREYSRLAARHIGTDHTELPLSGEDVRQHLPRATASFDQPSMDGLNTYFVSKAVRDAGLTVALSGVGGDELFGGYSGYSRALVAERWGRRSRRLPRAARSLLAAGLSLPPTEKARRAADLLRTDRDPYFLSRQVFGPRQIRALLDPGVQRASEGWEPARFTRLEQETAGYDSVNRASALELQTYMLSTLLRDTDQMSMAHSLEVRVPLVDHLLVEHMFRFEGPAKLDPRQPKPLLTLPLGDAIPDGCVHRPKRGFELPLAVWLRESLQGEMAASFLGDANPFPFTRVGLKELWAQFRSGRVGWGRVWAIYVLRRWLSAHGVTA